MKKSVEFSPERMVVEAQGQHHPQWAAAAHPVVMRLPLRGSTSGKKAARRGSTDGGLLVILRQRRRR